MSDAATLAPSLTAPKSMLGNDSHNSAPAPKAAHDRWNGKSVPTADQILDPDSPDLTGAGRKTLEEAVAAYTTAAYSILEKSLARVTKSLHEPPKPPDRSFADAAMAFLVKQLTEAATLFIGGGIIGAAEGVIGAEATRILNSKLTQLSKQASESMSGLVKEKPPGATRSIPHSSHIQAADPSAKTLLDEFVARQENALAVRQADAKVMVSLLDAIPSVDHVKLGALAYDLRNAADTSGLGGKFEEDVVIGWMNFCASIALGERKAGEPEFYGANAPGGIVAARAEGHTEFQGGQEGFINVEIDIPDQIWGTQGLSLVSLTSPNASEGLVQTLKSRNTAILATPVYRRIWLGKKGQGPLMWDPVMIISPDGSLSTDLDQPLLAAIGRLAPLDFESAGALSPGERSFARYASLGASMLMSWLGQIRTESIQ